MAACVRTSHPARERVPAGARAKVRGLGRIARRRPATAVSPVKGGGQLRKDAAPSAASGSGRSARTRRPANPPRGPISTPTGPERGTLLVPCWFPAAALSSSGGLLAGHGHPGERAGGRGMASMRDESTARAPRRETTVWRAAPRPPGAAGRDGRIGPGHGNAARTQTRSARSVRVSAAPDGAQARIEDAPARSRRGPAPS